MSLTQKSSEIAPPPAKDATKLLFEGQQAPIANSADEAPSVLTYQGVEKTKPLECSMRDIFKVAGEINQGGRTHDSYYTFKFYSTDEDIHPPIYRAKTRVPNLKPCFRIDIFDLTKLVPFHDQYQNFRIEDLSFTYVPTNFTVFEVGGYCQWYYETDDIRDSLRSTFDITSFACASYRFCHRSHIKAKYQPPARNRYLNTFVPVSLGSRYLGYVFFQPFFDRRFDGNADIVRGRKFINPSYELYVSFKISYHTTSISPTVSTAFEDFISVEIEEGSQTFVTTEQGLKAQFRITVPAGRRGIFVPSNVVRLLEKPLQIVGTLSGATVEGVVVDEQVSTRSNIFEIVDWVTDETKNVLIAQVPILQQAANKIVRDVTTKLITIAYLKFQLILLRWLNPKGTIYVD